MFDLYALGNAISNTIAGASGLHVRLLVRLSWLEDVLDRTREWRGLSFDSHLEEPRFAHIIPDPGHAAYGEHAFRLAMRYGSPIRQQDDHVCALRLSETLALLGVLQPSQRTAEGTAAASAYEQPLAAHELAHSGERFVVGCLQPDVDLGPSEHVRDEVVTNAFDDV